VGQDRQAVGRPIGSGGADARGPFGLCYGGGILAGRQAAGVCISGHNRQAVGRPIGSGGADARGPFERCSGRGILAGRQAAGVGIGG